MKITLTSVFVDDQSHALDFYTCKLGFRKRADQPLGEDRWLTLIAPEQQENVELLLEPARHPAVGPYRQALKRDGIPAASFEVRDLEQTVRRLKSRQVRFVQEPVTMDTVQTAIFDDTCGNLIQLLQRG